MIKFDTNSEEYMSLVKLLENYTEGAFEDENKTSVTIYKVLLPEPNSIPILCAHEEFGKDGYVYGLFPSIDTRLIWLFLQGNFNPDNESNIPIEHIQRIWNFKLPVSMFRYLNTVTTLYEKICLI